MALRGRLEREKEVWKESSGEWAVYVRERFSQQEQFMFLELKEAVEKLELVWKPTESELLRNLVYNK